MNSYRLLRAVSALYLLSAIGCAAVPPAPLQAGAPVARNRRYDKSPAQEGRHSLPWGTLTSTCSLVVLDPEELCFDLDMNAVADRSDLARLDSWRIFLTGDPKFRYEDPQLLAQGETEWHEYTGYRRTYDTYRRRVCDDSGNCRERTVEIPTGTVKETDNVVEMKATLCFPNHGEVSSATRRLRLAIEDPRGSVFTRQYAKFEWKLRNGVVVSSGG